eukprot:111012-Rhodomonas_salina.1
MGHSHGSWKDHNVVMLEGNPVGSTGNQLQPSRAQFIVWLDNFHKVLTELSLGWVLPMALALGFKNSLYLPLIGLIPGHQVMEDTYDDPVFLIVQRAIEAGALDHLPKCRDPLLDANNCNKNYRHVVASIASFSEQLAHRCSNAFPRIF